jgi:hypothetical protein
VHWTPQEPRCFTVPKSLSPVKPIPGTWHLTKKRQLSPGLLETSPCWFALPLMLPKQLSPLPGSGILTWFPFAILPVTTVWEYRMKAGTLIRDFSPSLRTDWPMFNYCSHGTLLHIGPQGSHLSICYYHQDLQQWKLQADLRQTPSTLSLRSSYSLRLISWFSSQFHDCLNGQV